MSKTATTRTRALPIRSGIAALLSLIAAAATAHDVQDKFELTVIRNAAHGAKITSGKPNDAIEELSQGHFRSGERFFAENNLCVALTMTAKFAAASESCERAVGLMLEQRSNDDSRVVARYYAMALSNRGVLNALAGDSDLARDDFESARKLRAGLTAPSRNLAYLERRGMKANLD